MPREIKSTNNTAVEHAPEQGPVEELSLEAKILDFLQSEDVELLPDNLSKYSNLITKHLNGELVSKRDKMIAASQYKNLAAWFTTEYEGQIEESDPEEEEAAEEEQPEEEVGQMTRETLDHIRYDNQVHARLSLEGLAVLLEDPAGMHLLTGVAIMLEGNSDLIRLISQRLSELEDEENA